MGNAESCYCLFTNKQDLNKLLVQAYSLDKSERKNARNLIETECPILYELMMRNKKLKLYKKHLKYQFNFKSMMFRSYVGKHGILDIKSFQIDNSNSRKGKLVMYGKLNRYIGYQCTVQKHNDKYIAIYKGEDEKQPKKFTINIMT